MPTSGGRRSRSTRAHLVPLCFFFFFIVIVIVTRSGVGVECGHGVTSMMPVYEGWGMRNAARRQEFAGADLSAHLRRLLTEVRPAVVGVVVVARWVTLA